jgi:hypothetical protein
MANIKTCDGHENKALETWQRRCPPRRFNDCTSVSVSSNTRESERGVRVCRSQGRGHKNPSLRSPTPKTTRWSTTCLHSDTLILPRPDVWHAKLSTLIAEKLSTTYDRGTFSRPGYTLSTVPHRLMGHTVTTKNKLLKCHNNILQVRQ